MQLEFTPRSELTNYEWDFDQPQWQRLKMEGASIKDFTEPSNGSTFFRVGLLYALMVGFGIGAVMVARFNVWLSIPVFYVYFFFFGFQLSILHEGNHRSGYDFYNNSLSIYFPIICFFFWS